MVSFGRETITTNSIYGSHLKKLTDKIIGSKKDKIVMDMSSFPPKREFAAAIVTLFTRSYECGKEITFQISPDMYKLFNYSGMTDIINFTVT